jgi:hypothetical protein
MKHKDIEALAERSQPRSQAWHSYRERRGASLRRRVPAKKMLGDGTVRGTSPRPPDWQSIIPRSRTIAADVVRQSRRRERRRSAMYDLAVLGGLRTLSASNATWCGHPLRRRNRVISSFRRFIAASSHIAARHRP